MSFLKKVYQEDKLFELETISSWKEKGQVVAGTNLKKNDVREIFYWRRLQLYNVVFYDTRTKRLYSGGSLLILSRKELCSLYSSKHEFYPKNVFVGSPKKFFLGSKKKKSFYWS